MKLFWPLEIYFPLASPCLSVRLQLIQGQPHAEAGGSRLRLHAQMAAMLAHDAHGVVEAKAKPFAGCLGGEERLEDALLQLGRDAGPGIPDLNQQHIALKPACNTHAAIV